MRKNLQSYHPPCFCGGAGDWTRAVYLNMSDPNQQCPSNRTLVTTSIRGCGRKNISQYSCDSATFSVHGHTYSSVCGRILAYQDTIDEAYLSGVSLTHGQAGSRQHIWSFVGASHEQKFRHQTAYNCPCTNTNVSWHYHFLIVTISVILGTLDLALTLLHRG